MQKSNSKKLGDKLFGQSKSDEGVLQQNFKELAKTLSSEQINQMIANDSPEFGILVKDFLASLDMLNNKLKPILEKADRKQIETKHGMTYLEMKYNLLLSYCTFLSFYLLMKLEGKQVSDHPVIFKLTHIKTLLEKLRPLD